MRIPVYKAEREAGLVDKISTNASVIYASMPVKVEQLCPTDRQESKIKDIARTLSTNIGQIDLFYTSAILATIGWNLNDEVFDKKEVYIARSTPEDKPLNIEHNPRKIVGHITSNYMMDVDGKVLSENLAIDELPDKFHLVANSVVYRFLKSIDESLEKEQAQLIDEISKGEWCVSLEALFTDFDYAIQSVRDNTTKVVKRDEESAYLTKHLRVYGGKGQVGDYKIGRLLRNITFSGKGFVKNPANPESLVLSNVSVFTGTLGSFKELSGYLSLNKDVKNNQESNSMADNNELNARVSSLEATLQAANERNKQLEKQLVELGQQQVQARLTALEGEIKTRDERLSALSAQVETEQKARTTADARVKELESSLNKSQEELSSIKKKEVRTNRVSKWVDRTGASLDDAGKSVDKFSKLDDTDFDAVLETQPAKTQVPAGKSDNNANNTSSSSAKVSDAPNPDTLKDLKSDNSAVVTPGSTNNGVEATRSSISKMLSGRFLGKNRQGDDGETE